MKSLTELLLAGMCALITVGFSVPLDRGIITGTPGQAINRSAVPPILELADGIQPRQRTTQVASFAPSGSTDACADSIANCGDPIKHLGTQNECACFACGYGTANQRTVCTKNAADKKALFARAR